MRWTTSGDDVHTTDTSSYTFFRSCNMATVGHCVRADEWDDDDNGVNRVWCFHPAAN